MGCKNLFSDIPRKFGVKAIAKTIVKMDITVCNSYKKVSSD